MSVPTIVADIFGHARLLTTARYVHSKPDALLDISSRIYHIAKAISRVAFGRPFLSKGESGHVHREINDLRGAAGRLRDFDGHQRSV